MLGSPLETIDASDQTSAHDLFQETGMQIELWATGQEQCPTTDNSSAPRETYICYGMVSGMKLGHVTNFGNSFESNALVGYDQSLTTIN
jgi:hypothetical protein